LTIPDPIVEIVDAYIQHHVMPNTQRAMLSTSHWHRTIAVSSC